MIMNSNKGFTLVEILVVLAIISIVGTMLVVIFSSTLRGSNKSQVLAAIKQNGQAILDNMDRSIRNADNVACRSTDGNTLVIVKNGCYTRYRLILPSPSPNPTQNGQIQQDNPQPDPDSPCPQNSPSPTPKNIKLFTDNVCTDPMVNPNILTDTNPQSGVSATQAKNALNNDVPFFTRVPSPGYKDSIGIQFRLQSGVRAPAVIAGQIDPVPFQTTVGLR